MAGYPRRRSRRPETAGQVAYILDSSRSLENQLREDIKLAGLDILGIQPQVIVLTPYP